MESEAAEARYSLSRFAKIVEELRVRISETRQNILQGTQHFAFLENANPEKYQEVLQQAGASGIQRAEQQLALYFTNKHWADFLETLDNVRAGIHFMGLKNGSIEAITGAGQSAVTDEYARKVMKLWEQMSDDVKRDIIAKMESLPITKDGVNLDKAGLHGGTTTWAYAVDEGAMQFNRLQSIAKNIRGMLSGEDGILTNYYRRKRDKMAGQG